MLPMLCSEALSTVCSIIHDIVLAIGCTPYNVRHLVWDRVWVNVHGFVYCSQLCRCICGIRMMCIIWSGFVL